MVALALALGLGGAAWANCLEVGNPPREVDPAEVGVDTVPPGPLASVEVTELVRGGGEGCNSATGESCPQYGYIKIVVSDATDDRTPAIELAYLLEVVSGSSPGEVPEGPVQLVGWRPNDRYLHLEWYDRGRPLSMTLSIRAVDLAGNVGPATLVEIDDPGSADGCRVEPATQPAIWCFVVIGSGVVGRRRRRSQRP